MDFSSSYINSRGKYKKFNSHGTNTQANIAELFHEISISVSLMHTTTMGYSSRNIVHFYFLFHKLWSSEFNFPHEVSLWSHHVSAEDRLLISSE